ncbi:MAG TPA: hypothetical protein ENH01_00990 [Nitrospirae bacterium]|nr:hypothetical protein [Nitrospirota bacterium]
MMKRIHISILILALALILGIASYGVARMMEGGAIPAAPVPESNPLTSAKIHLGKRLFMDRNLSNPDAGKSRVACSTCHSPMLGFSDARIRSEGVYDRLGKRNSPTVFNTAYLLSQFWDGRAQYLTDPVTGEILQGTSLEAQALGPVQDPLEMNNTPENVVTYVLSAYRNELFGAFPEVEQYIGTSYEVPVVFQAVGKAIASYERTVLAFNSPYDFYAAGNTRTLFDEQIRGLEIFEGKGNCTACHPEPLFTDTTYDNPPDTGFHNIGVFREGYETGTNDATGEPLFPNSELPEYEGYDLGRYYVTSDTSDIGKFKTPPLRQLLCTGPYMHNGKYSSIRDAVEFVVKGTVSGISDPYEEDFVGDVSPVIIDIRNESWNEDEINDLTAFLEALSGGRMCGGM